MAIFYFVLIIYICTLFFDFSYIRKKDKQKMEEVCKKFNLPK